MKKSIKVQAGPQSVWKAILGYRESQPHRRRILSKSEGKTVIEESFTGLPMVGSSRVVYEEVEHPFERIDFKLIEADHLSKFQGSWRIVSTTNPNESDIHVDAEFDIDMAVPFKENILNQLAETDIAKRLAFVKQTAESDRS